MTLQIGVDAEICAKFAIVVVPILGPNFFLVRVQSFFFDAFFAFYMYYILATEF